MFLFPRLEVLKLKNILSSKTNVIRYAQETTALFELLPRTT